ncbi:MAG: hypothetical protein Q7U53_13900 [Anaerolineaceae bacterium]|nr:hypothetical protein [Anaerolineaceae bacterium]
MNNSEILDFITKKENLQIAMEVSKQIDDLKDSTHHDFWVAMNQEIARLVEQNCSGKWVYHKFNLNAHKKPWSFANVRMVQPTENILSLLVFRIGQDSKEKNFQILCGVLKHNTINPDLTTLRGLLVSINLDRSDEWWAGLGILPIEPYTPDFIHEMYNNKHEYIKKCASTFWEKFIILRPELERINHQLIEAHQNMDISEQTG